MSDRFSESEETQSKMCDAPIDGSQYQGGCHSEVGQKITDGFNSQSLQLPNLDDLVHQIQKFFGMEKK